MSEDGPVLQIHLELESSVFEKAHHLVPQIADAVGVRISEMMRALGVPGRVVIEIDSQQAARKWLGLRVGGKSCRYPDVLLNTVRAYLAGTHRSPETNLNELLEWIRDAFERKPDLAVATIVQVCEAVLERQSAVLFQDEQAKAYSRCLDENPESTTSQKYDCGQLKRVLRAVLGARCSVADKKLVKRALSANPENEAAIADRVINEASKEVIEIRAGKELHDALVAAGRERELVSFARNGLYEQLGVLYPRVTLVADATLLPTAFRFRINCLETPPVLSVGTGKILVNDTSDRLKSRGVEAISTLNIATDQPAALVDASHEPMLEEAGLTVWDEWEFVILALAEALRQNAACFVNSQFTSMQLRRLTRDYPKVVNLLHQRIPVETLNGILRGLVEERIPVRDQRLIFERLLDTRYASDPLSRYVVLEDRLTIGERSTIVVSDTVEWNVEFVRTGLKAQLAHEFSRKTGTLVVYLLSDDVERLLMNGTDGEDGLAEVDSTRVLDAIHAELAYLPPTAQRPLLLTCGAARLKLWRLVQTEIPRMTVLAHEELPRDLNVQPIARISLSA
jgi:flagellar biosynthesis component FlhA